MRQQSDRTYIRLHMQSPSRLDKKQQDLKIDLTTFVYQSIRRRRCTSHFKNIIGLFLYAMSVIGDEGIRMNVSASFRVIRKKKAKMKFSINLRSEKFLIQFRQPGNHQYPYLCRSRVKKGLHASIKNIVDVHWTCVCVGKRAEEWNNIAETQAKRLPIFLFPRVRNISPG